MLKIMQKCQKKAQKMLKNAWKKKLYICEKLIQAAWQLQPPFSISAPYLAAVFSNLASGTQQLLHPDVRTENKC